MPTGDGLLARLMTSANIPLASFGAVCEASERFGNGIMEITQRGNLQIRGLCPASAPRFAQTIVALGLGTDGEIPILTSPLTGLDPLECADLGPLALAIRGELSRFGEDLLGPKVCVLIDGGGHLHLDDIPGDVRVQARGGTRLHLSVAGTAATSTRLGSVEYHRAADAVARIMAVIARRGRAARARDVVDAGGIDQFKSIMPEVLADDSPPCRARAEPLGRHPLKSGTFAVGIALPFGFSHAALLKRIIAAAERGGAQAIRPAPGRALLFIGLTADAADAFIAAAAAEELIVALDDPRRHVIACAGAPACASATLATRQLAPLFAQAAKSLLGNSFTIHVSGCGKGCAHAGRAELTLIGPDGIKIMGRAGDPPDAKISPLSLAAGLARVPRETLEQLQLNSSFGAARMIEALGAVPCHD
jgi:precorrin-3B synthase